jgi:pilus assembly protein CpaE
MDKIKIIIAAASPEQRDETLRLLNSDKLQIVATVTPDSAGLNKAGFAPADVLVLASDTLDNKETDFVERLYMTRPGLVNILMTREKNADILQKALLCGIIWVTDINNQAENPVETIISVLNREKNRQSSANSCGFVSYASEVMAFFGTKGGVGKTTTAVNVAVSLAKLNKRVALIDLDLQFGDVGIFLDIAKADSIVDVVEENNYEYSVLASFLYKHSSGVRVLCAPSAPEYAEMVKPLHIEKIISGLRSEFDYIILDMPPAFNDISIAALEQCSEIFFVINPDISSLRNAQASIAVLEQLNLGSKLNLIINRDGFSNLHRKDLEDVLGRKALLVLPCDYKNSAKAVNRGIPLVLAYKQSKVAMELSKFAQQTVDKSQKA